MHYLIFSLPSCSECSKAKHYLDSKSINYKELSQEEFRQLYQKYKKNIKRENNSLKLPIIFAFSNLKLEKLCGIAQSKDELKSFLKEIK